MAESRQGEAYREVRLEGLGLVVLAAIVVVALTGSFFLGRWYESRFRPVSLAGGAADPLANVVTGGGGGEPTDVDESATYFDTLDGQEKQAEPSREMPQKSQRPSSPARAQTAAPPAPAGGDYFVQIAAISISGLIHKGHCFREVIA